MQLTTKEIADIVSLYNSQVMAKLDKASGGLFKKNPKYHSVYTSKAGRVLKQYHIPSCDFDIIIEAFKDLGNEFQALKLVVNRRSQNKTPEKIKLPNFASKIKKTRLTQIENPSLMSIDDLVKSISNGHLVYRMMGDYIKVETINQLLVGIKQNALFKVSESTPEFIERAMVLDFITDIEIADDEAISVNSNRDFIYVNKNKLSFSDIKELFDIVYLAVDPKKKLR